MPMAPEMKDRAAAAVFPPSPIWTGRATSGLIALLRGVLPQATGVLVPANICAIAVAGIVWAGMQPVFHDVSAEHGNTELSHLRAAQSDGCGAVLAVHNFGRPLEIEAIAAWCAERRLLLIEDVCNALGATSSGRPLGQFGDAALYSFNHGKIIDLGFGGAVDVRDKIHRAAVAAEVAAMPVFGDEFGAADKALESSVRLARANGNEISLAPIYDAYRAFAGHRLVPGRQADIEGALAGLTANIEHRRALSALYRTSIVVDGVLHVPVVEGEVPWRHNLLVPEAHRDALLSHLRSHAIPASSWYPTVTAIFSGRSGDDFPGASVFAGCVVNLWVDQNTATADALRTAELVVDFFRGRMS